jgi:hypothetical protein
MLYARHKYPTAESFRPLFDAFYNIHGHYPTTHEIEHDPSFPSPQFFLREYGGVKKLRELLGLPLSDLRSSSDRRLLTSLHHDRFEGQKDEVCSFLSTFFDSKKVSGCTLIVDKTPAVFKVNSNYGTFFVDLFHPCDSHSFKGSLILKVKKYPEQTSESLPVLFVQMNTELSQSSVDSWVANKKVPIPSNFKVLCFEEFKSYCKKNYAVRSI